MKQLHYLAAICLALLSTAAPADQKLTVLAAASLTNAVSEIASQFEQERAVHVASSFAASSALAKQIENGAPADIFISADQKWMNRLQDQKKIVPESRMNLLGNRLVVIAPKGRTFRMEPVRTFDFAGAFKGRLCTGDLESVPAGIYAKQSLMALNWWDATRTRIVGTQDVRAALAFVERGECAAGIVYETDARISSKVEIVGILPEDSHDAIVYPVAMIVDHQPAAQDFLDYLNSPAASRIFANYGFTLPNRRK